MKKCQSKLYRFDPCLLQKFTEVCNYGKWCQLETEPNTEEYIAIQVFF